MSAALVYSGRVALLCSHGVRRQLFTGQFQRPGIKSGQWRRLLYGEAKTSVKAIPLETAAKSRWSGKEGAHLLLSVVSSGYESSVAKARARLKLVLPAMQTLYPTATIWLARLG